MLKTGVLVKPGIKEGKTLAAKIEKWLRDRGVRVYKWGIEGAEKSMIPRDLDLLVVLGGDGSLLYAAYLLGESGVPILGVNLGGLGFLTEVKKSELFGLLKKFLSGELKPQNRMMLNATVQYTGGDRARKFTALNEFTIAKGALSRLIELEARVDGIYLTSFRADGLIVSTPTGSTAYCMAAGGPIVHPDMQSITLTPICAHTLTSRPLVIPGTSAVEIRPRIKGADVRLAVDGRDGMKLKKGHRVTIKSSQRGLSLISSPSMDYYSILRTKLGWGDR